MKRCNCTTQALMRALAAITISIGFLAPTARVAAAAVDDYTRSVSVTMSYVLRPSGTARAVRLIVLIPQPIPDKQEVLDLKYSLSPARIFDEGNRRYAEFVFDRLEEDTVVTVTADMVLSRYDFSRAAGTGNVRPERSPERYLRGEPYLETAHPYIVRVAGTINGRDEIDTVRKLYSFVTGTLSYRGYVSEDTGALRVLERRWGDCSDYSDALVALARAKGIAARPVDGFLVDYRGDHPRHTWVEIYTQAYGWVPFDPLLGHLGQASFDTLPSKYVYLSDVRNDPLLNGYHFYLCTSSGGSVRVTDRCRVVTKADTLAASFQ